MNGMTAFSPNLTKEEARMLSPLQLAYVGDSVHALLVRTELVQQDKLVRDMHRAAAEAVSAVRQAKALKYLLPMLTEEETDIVRRGRNSHPHHGVPKSASHADYAEATGLEALLGYLYLTGQKERLIELSSYFLGGYGKDDLPLGSET